MQNEDRKIFNIVHEDYSIKLETNHTKFKSLERIMMLAAREFVKKGKVENLRGILMRIESLLIR